MADKYVTADDMAHEPTEQELEDLFRPDDDVQTAAGPADPPDPVVVDVTPPPMPSFIYPLSTTVVYKVTEATSLSDATSKVESFLEGYDYQVESKELHPLFGMIVKVSFEGETP